MVLGIATPRIFILTMASRVFRKGGSRDTCSQYHPSFVIISTTRSTYTVSGDGSYLYHGVTICSRGLVLRSICYPVCSCFSLVFGLAVKMW
jgi:hypothetical protein